MMETADAMVSRQTYRRCEIGAVTEQTQACLPSDSSWSDAREALRLSLCSLKDCLLSLDERRRGKMQKELLKCMKCIPGLFFSSSSFLFSSSASVTVSQ